MGNDCCSNRTYAPTTFTEHERKILRDLYDDLTGLHRAKGNTKFNKNTVTYLFQENPEMGPLIYNFMYNNSPSSNVSYEAFEQALEVLIQDNKAYQLKEYRTYDKVDMLALLMLDNPSITKDDFQKISISYIQAFSFVRNLLKVFQYYSTVAKPIDEYAIKVVVDGAFSFLLSHGLSRPDWFNFLVYIKQNLIYANRCLRIFFSAKFLTHKAELTLPDLTKASNLINRDFVALLFLSNIYMSTVSKVEFLYSSEYSGFTFQRIVQAIESFHGPTYIIIKVVPVQENGYVAKDEQYSVIGGFSRLPWKGNGEYSGDSDCYVFSMVPNFRNYFPIEGGRYFTYLKAGSGYGAGLGFGGSGNKDFRIWIDGNDLNRSYVSSDDHTYGPGPLINADRSYIQILDMEIWGLNQEMYDTRTGVSREQAEITYNKRKIFGDDPLESAMNNFENRMDQISQNRKERELMNTNGGHDGAKRSYFTPSKDASDLEYSRSNADHNKRAAKASDDFLILGRRTLTPTNVGFDYDLRSSEKGRSTYIEPREYFNPFKDDYKGKDTSAFASPPRLSRGSRGSRGSPPYN